MRAAGKEADFDQAVRERKESLKVMAAAAAHLGLDPGEALTVKDFDRACRELGSDWRSGRVTRLWGLWVNAQGALQGARVPESRTQKAHRRALQRGGAPAIDEEQAINGVRLWLDTQPRSETTATFNAWRETHNDERKEEEPALSTAQALTVSLGVNWGTLKRIARGELTLAEARKKRARPRGATTAEWGELVGGRPAAEILGRTWQTFEYHSRKPDFPPYAAKVGQRRLWRRADIEAYERGERDYETETAGELQGEIVTSGDLGKRLGLSKSQVAHYIFEKRWDRVPEPEGQLGNRYWWWHESRVAEWEKKLKAGRADLSKKDFSRAGLTRLGFRGWVTFAELVAANYAQIPERAHGVYVVLRTGKQKPRYLKKNPASDLRGDPSVAADVLADNWVDGAAVVYIGKADPRKTAPHALRNRLKEFAIFGSGGKQRHWGGRLVWQLTDSAELRVAWMPTPNERARDVEHWLIEQFRHCYGKLPFANYPDRRGA